MVACLFTHLALQVTPLSLFQTVLVLLNADVPIWPYPCLQGFYKAKLTYQSVLAIHTLSMGLPGAQDSRVGTKLGPQALWLIGSDLREENRSWVYLLLQDPEPCTRPCAPGRCPGRQGSLRLYSL